MFVYISINLYILNLPSVNLHNDCLQNDVFLAVGIDKHIYILISVCIIFHS